MSVDSVKKKYRKTEMLNKEKFVVDILIGDCEGSQAVCAEKLGVSRGYLNLYLKSDEVKAGSKLLSGIYKYCIEHDRNPYHYLTTKDN